MNTRNSNDPDAFFTDPSLQPDPVFMGLRALFSIRPIGALRRWLDRTIEDRAESRYGTRIRHDVDRAEPGTLTEFPQLNDRDRDIAA